MTTIKAHFDGKVIVPDEPHDLKPDQRVVVHVEPVEPPEGLTADELTELAERLAFEKDDLAQMARAIEEGCERVDEDGW